MVKQILLGGVALGLALFNTKEVPAQKLNEVNHFSVDTLRWEKMAHKVYRKYAYGSNSTVAHLKLIKGAFIPIHQHPNEQVTYIAEGKVEVVIDGKHYTVSKGETIIIPPNKPHSFEALETTYDIDFFSPIRMDWLSNNASYFTANGSKKPELEVVLEMPMRPGNVTISAKGEIFATIHPLSNPSMQVVKVTSDRKYEPFPSAEWQHKQDKAGNKNTFDTPLGIKEDGNNRLWILDMGLKYGKTRLFAFDIKTKEKVFEYELPSSIAPRGSFVQDLAIDNINGYAYLADINKPGIIVVNLTKKSSRKIEQHDSFQSEDKNLCIDKMTVHFNGKPARVGINPITLSEDKETLYFGAMNGTKWYKLPTKLLREDAPTSKVYSSITTDAEKPISDGAATDTKGNHYFTNLGQRGIDFWNDEMKTLEPIIRDTRLDWPDNVAIGRDGYLYIAVNQLQRTPPFTGSEDRGQPPYYIYRVKIEPYW